MNPILLLPLLCGYQPTLFDYDGTCLLKSCDLLLVTDQQVDMTSLFDQVPVHSSHCPFVLKDSNEEVLHENTANSDTDTLKSRIHFYMDNVQVKDEITMDEVKDIKIQVGGQTKEIKVYVDDQLQAVKWNQGETVLHIEPKEQVLTVVVEDLSHNTSEERLRVHQKKDMDFQLSVADDSYTLDQSVTVTFKEWLGPEYTIVLEQEGQKETLDCPNEKNMSIPLDHTGRYTLYVQKKDAVNVISKKHSFYFTNEAPNIHFIQKGNKVQVLVDGYSIQEKKLMVNGEIIPWMTMIDVSTPLGQDETISLVGSVKDSFGQSRQSELSIRMDRKPPVITMKINDQLVNDIFTMQNFETAQIQTDENSIVECSYFKNGKPFQARSLQEALSSLMPADILQIHVFATDTGNNQSSQTYEIRKAQLLKEEVLKTKSQEHRSEEKPIESVTLKSYSNDTHSIRYRTWSFDPDRHLRLIQNQKESQTEQPSIRVMIYKGKQKRIRILLEKDSRKSCFTLIRINGKKISLRKLKKDTLGNTYYQFYMHNKKIHMEVQARNSLGNVRNLDRTILDKRGQKRIIPYKKTIDHLFWILRHG